jgi:hypothetical protein
MCSTHHLHQDQPGTARLNRAVLGRWASPTRTPDGQRGPGKNLLRYSTGNKNMNETEMLCDRIANLDSGSIIVLDTPTALKNHISSKGGKSSTLEDVFLEMTGKQLVNLEEESEP